MLGYNLGLITEGRKQWEQIGRDIAQMSRNDRVVWSDRLHAVFVRGEDFSDLEDSLAIDSTSTTVVDITTQERSVFDLALHIQTAKESNSLLIIRIKSMERALDVMIACSDPVQQLALLGPEAQNIASFAENWLIVKVLSTGSVFQVAMSGKLPLI